MGNSKWETVIKRSEQTVLDFSWNDKNQNVMPDRHIAAHRSADNDMIRVSNHIQYEPPNNHNRVQRLINIIQSSDIRVVSAVTTILNDNIK